MQASSNWVPHTPGAPPTPPGHTGRSCRSARATPALSAGPKALRPSVCPSFFLHSLPAPSALFPARPAAPSPSSLTSKQPLPLLTRTLLSGCVRPLTIHASHWAAPSPEAANQSWQRRARALAPARRYSGGASRVSPRRHQCPVGGARVRERRLRSSPGPLLACCLKIQRREVCIRVERGLLSELGLRETLTDGIS